MEVYYSGDTTNYAETSDTRAQLIDKITPNAYYTVNAIDDKPTSKDGYYDKITISAN